MYVDVRLNEKLSDAGPAEVWWYREIYILQKNKAAVSAP